MTEPSRREFFGRTLSALASLPLIRGSEGRGISHWLTPMKYSKGLTLNPDIGIVAGNSVSMSQLLTAKEHTIDVPGLGVIVIYMDARGLFVETDIDAQLRIPV